AGVLTALHFDHSLYRYAGAPAATYSDLNGWGHFAKPLFWFELYWSFAAGVLVCLAYALWPRGTERGLRVRLRHAGERLRGAPGWAAVAPLLGFAAVGGFVFYNTNILNRYVPSDEGERLAAEYEKHYGSYRDLPQPRIIAVRTDVDIFPAERRAVLRGEF